LSDLLYLIQTQAGFQIASTPTYHAADKHDTPPSHFKLTPGQPVLLSRTPYLPHSDRTLYPLEQQGDTKNISFLIV